MLLLAGAASAEVYIGTKPPEGFGGDGILQFTAIRLSICDGFLLECGGESLLIDGGIRASRTEMKQLLKKWGITRVDGCFNTHPHDDHIDCVQYLLEHGDLSAGAFLSPYDESYGSKAHQRMVRTLRERGIPYRQLHDHETMEVGGTRLTFYVWPEGKAPNDRSMMARLDFGGCSMLLTADVEIRGQQHFAAALTEEELDVDILKLPHHGYTGLEPAFFGPCSPEMVFASCGPDQAGGITSHMRGIGMPLMHSREGTIIFLCDGQDWYVNQYPSFPARESVGHIN